jgi:hypothetical protein
LNSDRTGAVKAWHGLGGDVVVPPRLPWEDKGAPADTQRTTSQSLGHILALVWPWCGLGVALGWLCTPESMPSICLVYGFVVALWWLWVAWVAISKRAFVARLLMHAQEHHPRRVIPFLIFFGCGLAVLPCCRAGAECPSQRVTRWRSRSEQGFWLFGSGRPQKRLGPSNPGRRKPWKRW